MGLDTGLLEDIVEYLKNNNLDLVDIKEIYRFLNENYDFSERQLSEHKQMAGQKEPNWMHDLRNLMGGAKGEGELINPKHEKWGIVINPITDFDAEIEFDSMVKEASKLTRSKEKFSVHRASKDTFSVVSFSSKEIVVRTKSGKIRKLQKGMVCKHLRHLADCGGSVDLGKLHRYKVTESVIVHLCRNISVVGESIVLSHPK